MAKFITSNGNSFNIEIGTYANTDPAKKDIQQFVSSVKNDNKYAVKLDVRLNKDNSRKEIATIKNDYKQLAYIISKYDANGKLVETTVKKVSDTYGQWTKATEKQQVAQQNLNKKVQSSKSIFQDFTDTFLKMAKFNTINMIYDGIINKMSEAIQITNDFDKAMTEFKKVTDTTNLSLSDYTEQLGELGEATARTTKFVWSNVQ